MDKYHLATAIGARDGLWDWSLSSNRVHFSPGWIALIGCTDDEVGANPEEWLRRVHPEDRDRIRAEIDGHLAGGASDFHLHHRMLHKSGTYRWLSCHGVVVRDDRGRPIRLMGTHSDVTADHVADPLTGLPNRLLFLDRLSRSIERARRQPDFLYAVLLVDVGPPVAEEPSGPTTGHDLLRAAARRLETCLHGVEGAAPFRGDDYVVARLQGNQFALLLDGVTRVADAHVVAEAVLAELLAPFRERDRQVFLHPSIGIALSVTGYTRTEDVLRDADAALYRARSLGGNRCAVFDTAVLASADDRLDLEADLDGAFEERQFVLFYQPIVALDSKAIVGFEALVRWQHPTRGMIPPLEFIPIAEKTGLIVRLGAWILREACLQLKAWQESIATAADLVVSVNLSSVQLTQRDLVEQVGSALRDTGLAAPCLLLELTESLAMDDPVAVKTLLMQLRLMGVRIGLDDFGTGHSSLAYLHEFPADVLKVDQSFVRGIEARQDKTDIVGTVISLAGQLGLKVIAEGIESAEGLALVRSLGCECGQGFLFSRPVDADAAAALLRDGVPGAAPGVVDPPVVVADASPPGKGAALVVGDHQDSDMAQGEGQLLSEPDGVLGRRLSTGRTRHLYVGALLTSVALLAATGLPSRAPWPGDAAGAPVVAKPTRSSDTTGATDRQADPSDIVSPRATVENADSAPPVLPPERSPDGRKAAPARPSSSSFSVVHQHVIGSCRGVLNVSRNGVSYVPGSGTHTLTLERGRFQPTVKDDALTLKAADKKWSFKAADAKGKDASAAQLRAMLKAVVGAQRK